MWPAMSAVLTLLLVGCGSGASGTVAQQAKQAVSAATVQAEAKLTKSSETNTASEAATSTTSSKPATVTQAAKSHTVTETTTASKPAQITSINNSATAVKVAPTSTAAATDSGGGVPWWGWVLIVLGVVVIGIAIFSLGRRHGGGDTPAPEGRPGGS